MNWLTESALAGLVGVVSALLPLVNAEAYALIAATRTHYSLRRTDPRAGTVHVHFPRIGYVLKKADAT